LKAFVGGEEAVGLFGLFVLTHALVERGEEEVLEDGEVVGGAGLAFGIESFEEFGEGVLVEEFFRDEVVLFLEEPAEDESGEQADESGGAPFLVVLFEIVREIDLLERPEIPVGEFLVEAVVEQLDVEDLLPGSVEGVEVCDGEFLRVLQLGEGKGLEDVNMSTVGSSGEPCRLTLMVFIGIR
jgi:hypothetical protein